MIVEIVIHKGGELILYCAIENLRCFITLQGEGVVFIVWSS